MGQSLSQLYVHLTFGTKDRYPFISEVWNKELLAYMNGILKNLDSVSVVNNSVEDHVHFLIRMSKNYALSKTVEILKRESSKWIKEYCKGASNFSWQTGYGAFSVSSSKVDIVKKYIENQKNHHRYISYKDEVVRFFKEYNLEYNEEFYWR